MLLLREAAYIDDEDARTWALYAAQCVRAGRLDSAVDAYARAVWLREREGAVGKARTTRLILSRLAGDRAA